MPGFRIVVADLLRAVNKRFPERGHVLPEFAYNHVAAVEPEIAEILGSALQLQLGAFRFVIILHDGPGGFFVMRVYMADKNLTQWNAVPFVPLSRLIIAQDNVAIAAAIVIFLAEGHWLRKAVRKSEMFAADAVFIEPQFQWQP